MSLDIDYNNRQLIPRLLPVKTANFLSLNLNTENKNLYKINEFEKHNYLKLKEEWKVRKDIILGVQILSYEIVHEDLSITSDITIFLKNNYNKLNVIEQDILNISILKLNKKTYDFSCSEDLIDEKMMIKSLRNQTRIDLYNPIIWCDIGYYYTVLGCINKAKKAYKTAIYLNNSNRFIVRSVARFFLHINELDFAHNILIKSPRLKYDSGILTAEIAISALLEKKSKNIDYGKQILNNDNITLIEKNELLAQFATLEFEYGKQNKGKKFVERCLMSPNENSLAQFEFLFHRYNFNNNFDSTKFNVLCQYEALTRSNFINKNFEEALKNSKLWYKFQPFSHKPAILASYIASTVLENYDEAIQITKEALQNSPDNSTLINNLAFAFARSGKIEEAKKSLDLIDIKNLDTQDAAVIVATRGYILLKSGFIDQGKQGYEKAIKYFKNVHNEIYLSRALYFYGLALKDINIIESKKNILESNKIADKNNIIEIKYLINKNFSIK